MLIAAIALLAIVAGAIVTGGKADFAAAHGTLGIAALALACFRVRTSRAARIAAALGAIECLVRNQSPAATILHACLSPMFFTACVAMGLKLEGGVSADGAGFRMLVKSAPALVLMQIILGACYRHKLIGVMPHMAGAMLVAGLLLAVCTVILQRFPQSSPLRTGAGALLGIVLLQVSLGIAVFVMRLLDLETTAAFLPAAVAHVTVGSLTLAATTVLALAFTPEVHNTQSSVPPS